jgi:hypothetical protein
MLRKRKHEEKPGGLDRNKAQQMNLIRVKALSSLAEVAKSLKNLISIQEAKENTNSAPTPACTNQSL